jgi:GNAT superfamily N-acetyltransferase
VAAVTISHTCEACGTKVDGADLQDFGDAFIVHVRADHADWPFPDVAVRNYAEATQRLAPVRPRHESIGHVDIHPVTEDRLDDWLAFFDTEAFAGKPEWAACYCSEPHMHPRGVAPEDAENRSWRQNREITSGLLRSGRSFGYLAYVDGKTAGWVNASKRSEYALYRLGDTGDPPDADVIGVSCFIIAPPYRRHGISAKLLDRVIADSGERGAIWIEGYPFKGERDDDAANFRGPRSLYDTFGFELAEERARDVVVRLPAF